MGFIYQTYPIVGGTVLIIEQVQSQNYVAGVAGWVIKANGDIEINNLVARGSLIAGPVPGRHIEINTAPSHLGEIALFTGVGGETESTIGPQPGASGVMYIRAAAELTITTPLVRMGAGGGNYLVVQPDPNAIATILPDGVSWFTPAFLNSWVDVAGSRVNYMKDACGNVHLRGQLQNGVAVTMFTLPAGYRPTQSMQFVMRSAAAAGNYSVVQVQTNGDVVVLTNFAMAQIACRLDITFPTF